MTKGEWRGERFINWGSFSRNMPNINKFLINTPHRGHIEAGMSSERTGCRNRDGLVEAIKYASKDGGILQSLEEAAAFNLNFPGIDNGSKSQITRTAAIFYANGRSAYVAFTDDRDPKANIVITGAKDGITAEESGLWTLEKRDDRIRHLLELARQNKRVVKLDRPRDEIYKISEIGLAKKNPIAKATLCEFADMYIDGLFDRYKDMNDYPLQIHGPVAANILDRNLGSKVTILRVEINDNHIYFGSPFTNGRGYARGVKYLDTQARLGKDVVASMQVRRG